MLLDPIDREDRGAHLGAEPALGVQLAIRVEQELAQLTGLDPLEPHEHHGVAVVVRNREVHAWVVVDQRVFGLGSHDEHALFA